MRAHPPAFSAPVLARELPAPLLCGSAGDRRAGTGILNICVIVYTLQRDAIRHAKLSPGGNGIPERQGYPLHHYGIPQRQVALNAHNVIRPPPTYQPALQQEPAMTRSTRRSESSAPRPSALDPLIERVNTFSADNYWDLGKFLVEKVIPAALKEGIFSEQILKRMAGIPGFKFPFTMLKQCQRFYTYYPDVEKRLLPDVFYFELASRVEDARKREHYEKAALANKWTISDLQKKIRDDELARREDEKTRFGFDLKERNVWFFETPDPRFGRSGFQGRMAGQIVANAIFHYTRPGAVIVDPMAGSGTTADVIESLPSLADRTCRSYDLEPADERIQRINILQTGIPEQSGTVDYVFLDPPHELYPSGFESEFAPATVQADTMAKLRTIIREGVRILKPGGRMSIVVEPSIGRSCMVDFPYEVGLYARELKMSPIGKVYLPKRGETGRPHPGVEASAFLRSECRELLTFEKLDH